eukprot:COSAG05_NODE_322_length_11414_cov_47.115510_3_plen_118_part_00
MPVVVWNLRHIVLLHTESLGPIGFVCMQKGEYNLLDVTPLEHFPTLDYFAQRPGRSALIIDDRHLHDLSKKGNPSQKELADRICGHVSSHHPGGLSIFIAQQTFVAIQRFGEFIDSW